MPEPGPPESMAQGCISTCHVPAISLREFFASMSRPEQPVFLSTKRTCSQFVPPSMVR